MTCIKMGSDESCLNVSQIAWDKVTRQCPQTTTFEEKGRRAEAVSNRGPSAYQPNALPLGQTGSQNGDAVMLPFNSTGAPSFVSLTLSFIASISERGFGASHSVATLYLRVPRNLHTKFHLNVFNGSSVKSSNSVDTGPQTVSSVVIKRSGGRLLLNIHAP